MAVINGTPSRDVLWGTSGADEIHGGDGDDQVGGGSGPDLIFGDGGDDNIFGEAGSDTLDGGAGADNVYDQSGGDDRLVGGPGNDFVRFDPGNIDQTLYRPTLDGGDGDDNLYVSGNLVVQITGGAGADSLQINATATGTIDLGAGNDVVVTSAAQNSGAGPPLSLTLGSGADTIRLATTGLAVTATTQITDFNPLEDRIEAIVPESLFMRWNGQNLFTTGHLALAQSGADVVLRFDANGGGDGYLDLFRFTNLQVSQFAGRTIFGFDVGGAAPSVRTVRGTENADSIGPDGDAPLRSGVGPDSILGLGGGDFITGGAGNDTIDGGAGADVLYGGLADDLVRGGDGDDILGGAGFDRLFGDAGADQLNANLSEGVSGSPTLDGGSGDDRLYVYLRGDGSTAVARGGDGADLLDGHGAGAMTLDGGGGNDVVTLHGADGAVIVLGSGVDTVGFDTAEETASTRVTILDFQAGTGGDRLDLTTYFETVLVGWDRNSNPFATGDARLVASGVDTVLQVKGDGGGYRDLLTLRNVASAALRPENLSGYAPDGRPASGVTLSGGAGPDTLTGGPDGDVLAGQGGSDSVEGAAGADALQGGDGSDTLRGGNGDDTVEGQAGDDDLSGGDGVDLVRGGDGNDVISETFATNDRVFGDAGADRLSVSFAGNTSGEFLVDGGEGDDNILYSTNRPDQNPLGGTVRLLGGGGADLFTLLSGPIFQGVERVIVDAGAGADRVEINGVANYEVTLGAGADVLYPVLGVIMYLVVPDVVVTDFNVAEDRIMVFANPLRVAQQPGETIFQVENGEAPDGWLTVTRLPGVAAASLTAANYAGVQADLWLLGGPNADVLSVGPEGRVDGAGGDDVVRGAGGADTLLGASGSDTLTGDAGGDSLGGGSGDDQLFGGDGGDTLIGNAGSNYLRGEAGDDVVVGGTGFDNINGNMGRDTIQGAAGDDWVLGGKDSDIVSGDGGKDIVNGNIGDDTCAGGDGNDIVRGGQDNDILNGGAGDDFVSGDRGDDTVTGGTGADNFHMFQGAGIDRVTDFVGAQGDRVQLDPGTQYAVSQVGADVVIDIVGGGQMILVGIQMSTLSDGWIFGA